MKAYFNMATVYPFRALRPALGLAAKVASVPYDVVNREEAATLARGVSESFLRVTRPEIDMEPNVNAHSDAVYERGAHNFQAMQEDGVLVRDETPALYIYSITMNEHTQTGIVLLASIDEYERNEVKKHEFTRPDKEDDRAHHMEILGAQSGKVFLVHRKSEAINALSARITQEAPWADFVAEDGVRHRVWSVVAQADIDAYVAAFAANGPLYIADGHHRSAAAARVKKARGSAGDGFLAVSFSADDVQILPYNRVVQDLRGMTVEEFLKRLEPGFSVAPGKPSALERHQFGLYVDGRWLKLTSNIEKLGVDLNDPVDRLDVSILQKHILQPLLGIDDPRRDTRIDFVGGIRGDAELERRVANGAACAFSLYPTSIEDLLAIADAEEVMPPKSTWFEPKLRDGLFVNLLEP